MGHIAKTKAPSLFSLNLGTNKQGLKYCCNYIFIKKTTVRLWLKIKKTWHSFINKSNYNSWPGYAYMSCPSDKMPQSEHRGPKFGCYQLQVKQ